jgi:hypothetical protein
MGRDEKSEETGGYPISSRCSTLQTSTGKAQLMTKPNPGSVQDALNYRFYRDRLDDPSLLDRAVITEDGDLAVPVGGKRRGGYVGVDTRAAGRRLIRLLAGRPDEFPAVRLVLGDGWLVEWGPELDWRGDDEHPEDYVAAGVYFGYSDVAIVAFARNRAARDLDDADL